MSENSASINLTANLDGTDKVTAQLNSVTDAATRTSDKIAAGNEKSARSLKSLSNSLLRMRADAESLGDPITAAVRKFEYLHPDIDTSSLAGEINQLRSAHDVARQYQEQQRELAQQIARAAKEHENLAKQIEIANAKAKEGMASTSAGYFRQLAQERNVNLTGKDNVNLAELERIQQANARTAALVKQADADAKRIASESRSFFSQIQSGIDHYATANMSLSEKLAYQIQAAGHNLQNYKPQLDQLKAMEQQSKQAAAAAGNLGGAMMKNGMTAKQYAAALRGVPAQMTDIVVSLASGQAPLTVLLQQGGQLKDMFGGVGGAVKALGSYVMGLVNPFTVFGTAIAAVGIAAYQGADESQKLQKSLIQTGYAAGVTRDQLEGIIRTVGDTTGEFGKARDAAMAFSKVSANINLDTARLAVQAIADTATVTGEKIEDIGARFKALGGSPVEAAMKLNENLNIMDVNTLKTVASLEKQGRTTEALAVLTKKYADEVHVRAGQVVANAGWMEQAWYGVRNAIVAAWDALKGFGRAQSAKEEIDAIEDRIASYRKRTDAGAAEDIRIAQQNLALAKERLKNEDNIAKAGKEQAKAVKDWYKEYQKGQRGSGRKRKGGSGGASKTSPEVSEYENLTKTIQQRTEALKQEIQYGDKLTEADRLRIRIENNAVEGKKKLTQAHQEELLAKVAVMKKLEEERDAKKFMADYEKNLAKEKAKLTRSYEDEIAVIGMGTKEAEAYRKKQEVLRAAEDRYQEALKKHVAEGTAKQILADAAERVRLMEEQRALLQEQYNDPWKALTESVRTYKEEAMDTGKQIRDAYRNAFSSMEDAFVKFATTGKLSFKDLVNSILADIARMMAKRVVSNFLEGIFSIGASAFSSWFGGSSGTTTTTTTRSAYPTNNDVRVGFRAGGGSVSGGSPYVVGEQGPELFVPKQSGTIISNDDLKGKGGLGIGGFNIQIQHRNEGTQQQVSHSDADFDGKSLIIKIVTQDIQNDGMISRTMSRTFGMRRAAGAM